MKRMTFIKTVFILCLMALPLRIVAQDYVRGDCDLDEKVDISDVTSLINYVLNGIWSEDESTVKTFTVNGVTFNMVTVDGGTFMMGAMEGDNEAYDDEMPAHQVTLSTFRIAETEVT